MIQVSEYVLKKMGLQPLSTEHPVKAAFHSLHVYEVRGFTLEAPALDPVSGLVAGLAYVLCIGSSVNAICRQLVQDNYVESEEEWQKQQNCTPPYLIIHLGPTAQYESTGSYGREEGRTITTYDSFPAAKVELKTIQESILPPLVSALACSFSPEPTVRFVPIHESVFGVTADNRTVHDLRFSGSASGYVSSKLEAAEIEAKVAKASKLASAMDKKVARFFQLALDENDPLKKFLCFFLAIEIETHATFKTIDHSTNLSSLIDAPQRVRASTRDLFARQRDRWVNLYDRFVWCSLCAWTHMSDEDIEEFKQLKEVRDNIAHGSIAAPPHSAVAGAEKIAAKLQHSP